MTTHRRLVLVGVLTGTFLASLDVTVVGTAMPTIIGKLGGLSIYPWVFSAYLLASTVTVPLYGKGADLFGRKPLYLMAVALFLSGSVLCATATTMEQLILWRAVQGLGAGGVLPVTLTIIGDLYPAEQRARIQGLFSGVWAVSSIAGPALGALIVEVWTWPWIFLINLPFGLGATVLVVLALHEEVERKRPRFDVLGATLLAATSGLLMWGMLHGGDVGFADPWVMAALGAALLLGLLLILQERRHPEPMIPPALLLHPVVRISASAGLFSGALLICVTSYVPTFVQGVLGGGPAAAGAAVLPIGVGWPLAATSSGWLLGRIGYRSTILLGVGCLTAGSIGLFFFHADMAHLWVSLDMLLLGLGMGFSAPMLLIAAQESVGWKGRGAVTALVQFSRNIGGAVGVAALGAVLTAGLRKATDGDSRLLEAANALLDPRRRGDVPEVLADTVREALGFGLLRVLLGISIIGLCACGVMLAFPRKGPPRREVEV